MSKAGKEKGRFFVVTEIKDNMLFLCDGKLRPLEKPKAKKVIHIMATKVILPEESLATDRKIRLALKKYNANQEE